MNENTQHVWRRNRLLVGFGGIASFSLFLVLAFPPIISRAYEAARKEGCRQNLNQIALALQNYHDQYACFPPAITYGPDGKPWHSWRALVMPFLLASSFGSEYRLDEPWDGPNNRRISYWSVCHPIFRCPSDGGRDQKTTSYVAVVGDETLWPPVGSSSLAQVRSSTIGVVEVHESGVHWLEPRDLRFDQMSFEINQRKSAGTRSSHDDGGLLRSTGGANVVFFDSPEEGLGGLNGCRFLTEETPAEELQELLTLKNEATNRQ